jgi:hypothetical protein
MRCDGGRNFFGLKHEAQFTGGEGRSAIVSSAWR